MRAGSAKQELWRYSRAARRGSASAQDERGSHDERSTNATGAGALPQATRRVLPNVVAAAFNAIHETQEQMKPRNRKVDSAAIADHDRFSSVKRRWAKRVAQAQPNKQAGRPSFLPKRRSRAQKPTNLDGAIYV